MQGETTGFRKDVEGLRAVAVVMVLLYHIGVGWAPGGFAGVDVFFVISGFLITGLLVREVERTGTIWLPGFYARRAKRLFPAAATVLVATAALCLWQLPVTRWAEIGGDIFASALYFINWRLAWRSVDYLAEDSVASPVQHFWSLAVEEQYYIVWPLIFLLGLWAAHRIFSKRKILWLAVVAVGAPSLAWSIYLTRTEQATAYFASSTRMWELAIGGAVALAAARWQAMGQRTAAVLGWLGLAAIAGSLALQSNATPWPGYAAALPTLGAAAVIVSGFSAGRTGPAWILGTRAFCWVGGLSYSLYLWHWPLIAVVDARNGGELPLSLGLPILALSVALAWLTQRFIENPIRYSSVLSGNTRYALSAGLNFSLVGAIAGLGLALFAISPGRSEEAPRADALGARVLGEVARNDPAGAPVDQVAWMVPEPSRAVDDVPRLYGMDCQATIADIEPRICEFGAARADAALTIAVVGDSKMAQWVPALEAIADQKRWRIMVFTKSACGFNAATAIRLGKPYSQCVEWNKRTLAAVLELKPDYVITSQGRTATGAHKSAGTVMGMAQGLEVRWKELQAAGIRVVALADNPDPGMKVYECVAENRNKLSACTFDRKEGNGTRGLREAAGRVEGVAFIDLTDAICPTARCAPVIGNVLIYRQGSHITKTYIQTLGPRLERALERAGVGSGAERESPAQSAGNRPDASSAAVVLDHQ